MTEHLDVNEVILDAKGLKCPLPVLRARQAIRGVPDGGLLRAELVIKDPQVLTEPWYVTRHFRRMPPGTKAYDYACAENNRNPITGTGQTLTLDTDGRVIDKVIENE